MPKPTQTYEVTIGGHEVGKRIEQLHLDGVRVVEKPDSPEYYPEYHEVLVLPLSDRVEKYGAGWKERADELSAKVDIALRDWIASSGIPHDIVVDLHDNTPHPNYRELVDRGARETNHSYPDGYGYVTKNGRLAVRQAIFFDVDYYSKQGNKRLEHAMQKFKPHPYVPARVEKMPPGLPTIPLSDFEIGVEFHPVTIGPFEGVRRYSERQGSDVVFQLLQYLRRHSY